MAKMSRCNNLIHMSGVMLTEDIGRIKQEETVGVLPATLKRCKGDNDTSPSLRRGAWKQKERKGTETEPLCVP